MTIATPLDLRPTWRGDIALYLQTGEGRKKEEEEEEEEEGGGGKREKKKKKKKVNSKCKQTTPSVHMSTKTKCVWNVSCMLPHVHMYCTSHISL
jgi:hypothetical protein